MDNLLTTDEMCKRLGWKAKWYILKLLRAAGVEVIKIGHKKVVVREKDFYAWMTANSEQIAKAGKRKAASRVKKK